MAASLPIFNNNIKFTERKQCLASIKDSFYLPTCNCACEQSIKIESSFEISIKIVNLILQLCPCMANSKNFKWK